jgi:hypothetical protein
MSLTSTCNHCADKLADFGLSLNAFSWWNHVPPLLLDDFGKNCLGMPYYRFCLLRGFGFMSPSLLLYFPFSFNICEGLLVKQVSFVLKKKSQQTKNKQTYECVCVREDKIIIKKKLVQWLKRNM